VSSVEPRPPSAVGLPLVEADTIGRPRRAVPIEDRNGALIDPAQGLDAVRTTSVQFETGAPIAAAIRAIPVAVRALVTPEVREVALLAALDESVKGIPLGSGRPIKDGVLVWHEWAELINPGQRLDCGR
jgi:hypothetical protein